jgi:uncharacterized membrane protein YcaP (DUF421 family)
MAAIRLMGKRQVGELQPTELVVTILLSELAAIPIQDNSIPMATSLVSAAVLIGFEILNSIFAVSSNKWRVLTQGHSLIVVRDGKPDLKQLKNLRISLDDLMEALRQQGVFDIADVEYAIVETTGKISVLQKPSSLPPTATDLNVRADDKGMPFVLVYDGEVCTQFLAEANMTPDKLQRLLDGFGVPMKDIMLLTVNRKGETALMRKNGREIV